MESYHPTLWRTCRVLANAGRLQCLKAVFEQPGRAVGEIAERAYVSETLASEHLRALQARGLIQASRESRWVRYAPQPDPLVAGSRRLLSALKSVLLSEDLTEIPIIRTLTAFTHPRRLELLRELQKSGRATFDDLVVSTRMSAPALSRHLSKLESRGLVTREEQSYRLAPCSGRLKKTLFALSTAEVASFHTSRSVEVVRETGQKDVSANGSGACGSARSSASEGGLSSKRVRRMSPRYATSNS